LIHPNVVAFLATIRHSEGTDKAPDPYRVVFGYTQTISDLSDHPAITGEWPGAHYTNIVGHEIFTTAAGAYQMIRPTWSNLKTRLALADFTAPSQDAAAIELIRQVGAIALIQNGYLNEAVAACHNLWASLPSSSANQPTVSFADLTDAYLSAGGKLA